jgi:putative ubiquitin-RnfH superfamily antitoxin RatB of RatAB toxin-antitoxin module
MRSAEPALQIELAWVDAGGRVVLRPLALPPGATLGDALAAIDLPALREGLTAGRLVAAVFGELKPPTAPLFPGDRVELLEGLQVDPKLARRRRAEVRRRTQAAKA